MMYVGRECWSALSSKHKLLDQGLIASVSEQITLMKHLNPEESPIDLIERLDLLFLQLLDLDSPDSFSDGYKVVLLLQILNQWDSLSESVTAIRRHIIFREEPIHTYASIVLHISGYWAIFGSPNTNPFLVFQLNRCTIEPHSQNYPA